MNIPSKVYVETNGTRTEWRIDTISPDGSSVTVRKRLRTRTYSTLTGAPIGSTVGHLTRKSVLNLRRALGKTFSVGAGKRAYERNSQWK